MSDVKAGDVMYQVSHGIGGSIITGADKVKKVTPTGIVVFENGTRLSNRLSYDGGRDERGGSVWHRATWYPEASQVVADARALTEAKKKRRQVRDAYEQWARDTSDRETCQALAEAVLACIESENNA